MRPALVRCPTGSAKNLADGTALSCGFRIWNLHERMKRASLHLRNAMEFWAWRQQIQFEDPDGNPIELFEPARRSHQQI